MNCAICTAFLREKSCCEGWYSAYRIERRHCAIFSCEQRSGRYCHYCPEYPCRRITQLDPWYRTRYTMSMIGNLAVIRENGIRNFVRAEQERWICSACKGTIDVHHGRCVSCGKEREEESR